MLSGMRRKGTIQSHAWPVRHWREDMGRKRNLNREELVAPCPEPRGMRVGSRTSADWPVDVD